LAHPAWKSWVAHHKVLCLALKHELSMDDMAELDASVVAYKKRFEAVASSPVPCSVFLLCTLPP
jgi:hypothetical protein